MQKSLKNGWIKVRHGDVIVEEYDPKAAELVLEMRRTDLLLFADCIEADRPDEAAEIREILGDDNP